MGLNEAAGYLGLAGTAAATGCIAANCGLLPGPFLLGATYIALGLGLSAVAVKETREHARLEASGHSASHPDAREELSTRQVFALTTFRDKSLSSVCQAGMVNNLNDGVAWGLFPIVFAAQALLAVGDVAHPAWRARSIGIYRLWRDGGFAVGAVVSGLLAVAYGPHVAIAVVACLTAASGITVAIRMRSIFMKPSSEFRTGWRPRKQAVNSPGLRLERVAPAATTRRSPRSAPLLRSINPELFFSPQPLDETRRKPLLKRWYRIDTLRLTASAVALAAIHQARTIRLRSRE